MVEWVSDDVVDGLDMDPILLIGFETLSETTNYTVHHPDFDVNNLYPPSTS